MIDPAAFEGLVKALLALILITGAFTVMRRDLKSLVSTYSMQSMLLSTLALILWIRQGDEMLLYLAALTIASKVLAIPYAVKRVQRSMDIRRDMVFEHISPAGSMIVTFGLILLVYYSFSSFLHELELDSLFYIGAVFGISLTLMGMLVTFTRRRIISKLVGYLTMENGVLLFGIFMVELPMIVEILVIIDLIILVLIATILATGIDGSIEEFQSRMNRLHGIREDD